MIKLFDRVKVNIPTTGTGDIEFGAAASTAFLTPTEAGVLDGDEVRYVIVDGLDFEEGVGLIKDTVATMERTVTKSKIGGAVGTSALNLSGTAVLALTASAADILTPDDNLASVEDADTALDNLGGTTVGKAVFTAADQAAAQAAIGATAASAAVITASDKPGLLAAVGAAWEHIATVSQTDVLSVVLASLDAFRRLRISGWCRPATDNVNFGVRTSTNNGSSFDSGATDYPTQFIIATGTTVTASSSGQNTVFINGGTGVSSGANGGVSFTLDIHEFNRAAYASFVSDAMFIDSASAMRRMNNSSQRAQATARNALQILFASGNIAACFIVVEGVRG